MSDEVNTRKRRTNRANPLRANDPITPHILYCTLSLAELKALILRTALDRKSPSAGRDLQEMKIEYRRRVFSKHDNNRVVDKTSYTKSDTVEDFANSKPTLTKLDGSPRKPLLRLSKVFGGLSAKQEKFSQALVATGSYEKAYIAAGYSAMKSNNPQLLRVRATNIYHGCEKIKKRVDNLKEEALRRMAWDAEKVLNKIAAVYDNSMASEDFTNANRSMEAIARHLGMFVDKSEQKIKMTQFTNEDSDEKVTSDIAKLADMVGLKVISGGKE